MHVTKYSGVGLVVLFACTSAAMGSYLPFDPNAYNDGTTTWRGTQPFAASIPVPGFNVMVNVDYAVYAPGAFSTSAALGNPTDPSNGLQYVYAYQLWNNVGGDSALSAFSVGFADAADSDGATEGTNKLPANIGYVNITGDTGVSPSSQAFTYSLAGNAQSAFWDYSSGLPVGGHSNVLIYTSPYPPETDTAMVQGSLSDTQRLPSPVPEPATGLLLGVATAFLLAARVRCARR